MIKRILKVLIAIVFRNVEKIVGALCWQNRRRGSCIVLAYHDVTPSNCHRFRWQMGRLRQLAAPVAADSVRQLPKGRKHAAVTFDDGFASTIDLVLPVLSDEAIPVTFFIPTAYLGKQATWIRNTDRQQCVGRVINADALRTLSKRDFVTIGSHGTSHRRLTEMSDIEVLTELAESKRILENITGRNAEIHAFPFGAYHSSHIKMAYDAGYNHVFTLDPEVVMTGSKNQFVIGRIVVNPSDWPIEFTLKVLGAYRWLSCISRLKNLLQHR